MLTSVLAVPLDAGAQSLQGNDLIPTWFLDDPSDDVYVEAPSAPGVAGTPVTTNVDIVRVEISETATNISIAVKIRDLRDGNPTDDRQAVIVEAGFHLGDAPVSYLLETGFEGSWIPSTDGLRFTTSSLAGPYGRLCTVGQDGACFWQVVGVSVDPQRAVVAWDVPRHFLTSSSAKHDRGTTCNLVECQVGERRPVRSDSPPGTPPVILAGDIIRGFAAQVRGLTPHASLTLTANETVARDVAPNSPPAPDYYLQFSSSRPVVELELDDTLGTVGLLPGLRRNLPLLVRNLDGEPRAVQLTAMFRPSVSEMMGAKLIAPDRINLGAHETVRAAFSLDAPGGLPGGILGVVTMTAVTEGRPWESTSAAWWVTIDDALGPSASSLSFHVLSNGCVRSVEAPGCVPYAISTRPFFVPPNDNPLDRTLATVDETFSRPEDVPSARIYPVGMRQLQGELDPAFSGRLDYRLFSLQPAPLPFALRGNAEGGLRLAIAARTPVTDVEIDAQLFVSTSQWPAATAQSDPESAPIWTAKESASLGPDPTIIDVVGTVNPTTLEPAYAEGSVLLLGIRITSASPQADAWQIHPPYLLASYSSLHLPIDPPPEHLARKPDPSVVAIGTERLHVVNPGEGVRVEVPFVVLGTEDQDVLATTFAGMEGWDAYPWPTNETREVPGRVGTRAIFVRADNQTQAGATTAVVINFRDQAGTPSQTIIEVRAVDSPLEDATPAFEGASGIIPANPSGAGTRGFAPSASFGVSFVAVATWLVVQRRWAH